MAFKNYAHKKFQVSVGLQPMVAFADDNAISIQYDEVRVEKHVGLDGFGIFVEVADVSGTATIRLADYSPSNAILSNFELAKTPVPILVTDVRSISKFHTTAAMVSQVPPLGKNRAPTMNEWQLIFITGKIYQGGAKPAA